MAAGTAKFRKSSPFGDIIDSVIGGGTKVLDFVDFFESPLAPKVKLRPVQYMLGKILFGIPLDRKEVIVPVYDRFREKLLYELPEREFLKYLYEHGQTHIGDWHDLSPHGYTEQEVIAGRRGGKALDVNEEIPTPNGFRRIGDLRAGDEVFGPDGAVTIVVQAHTPFVDQTYRVSFDDGTSVVCHGGHLWHTFSRSERRKLVRRKDTRRTHLLGSTPVQGGVRTTEEIRETLTCQRPDGKPERNHAVRISEALEMPEAQLPVDPYLLGLWLGDGAKGATSVTTMDPEIRDYVCEFARNHGLHISTWDNGSKATTYRMSGPRGSIPGRQGMTATNNWLRVALRELGVWENKHIPDVYLWASRSQRLALLQGLMDADGSCNRARCKFSNTNLAIAQGVYHLAASLGLKPFWTNRRATLYGKDCGPCYRVSWTGKLPVFRLPRKLKQLPQAVKKSQDYRYITAVDPVDVREVRCITVARPDGLFLFGRNFNVTHNSAYVAACSHYMLYRLLAIRNPQDYYGLIEGSTIDFTILAQNEEGSDRLYGQVRNGVNTCEFFRPYLYGVPGANELKLITEADRGKRDVLPSITVASLPCTTRSARGPSSIFLVLDEFAFFRNALGARSDEVYDSAKPATMQFVNPDGLCDAKVLTITSPWTRVGTVWDLHQRAMQQGADSAVFSLRVGTAIMNPKAPSSFLKEEFDRKPATWEAEYGGNFIDSAGSLVPPERIDFCVDTGRPNKVGFHQSSVGQVYFWGIDLGLKKDATALAIGHWEQDERGRPILIYDYIKRMIVGDEEHRNVDQLDVDEILNWFENMNMWLPGAFGATDQYAGASFITLCALRGINFIDLVHLTGGINSQMYFALQGYLNQGICRFPDYQPFVQELKNVEAFYVGKTTLKVEAPNEKDAHDDMCDAVALVAWQAQKWMLEVGNKGLAFSGYGSLLKPEDRPSIGNVDIQASSMSQLRMAESMRRSQWATARRGMLRS